MKNLLFLLLFFSSLSLHAKNHIVLIGDEKVVIEATIDPRKSNLTYVHLHQNETTALQAAQNTLKNQGGNLITIKHSGSRNIVFHLKTQRFEFDPNRIFTEQGIKTTLSQFGSYTIEAHHEVEKLARYLKNLLPQGKIIAVHNNATYSLKDYLPGHNLEHDAQLVHFSPGHFYRNFFLVTTLHDFLRLKNEGLNSILQNKSATDDGSLSIYLAHQHYINVEAGYDQLAQQMKMLELA